jgi:hypothetical protein
MNFTTIDYKYSFMLSIIEDFVIEPEFQSMSQDKAIESIYRDNSDVFENIEHVEEIFEDYINNYLMIDTDIEIETKTDYKLVFDDVLYQLNTIIEQSYDLVYNEQYNIDDDLHIKDCYSSIVKYQITEKEKGYDLADTLCVFL